MGVVDRHDDLVMAEDLVGGDLVVAPFVVGRGIYGKH